MAKAGWQFENGIALVETVNEARGNSGKSDAGTNPCSDEDRPGFDRALIKKPICHDRADSDFQATPPKLT